MTEQTEKVYEFITPSDAITFKAKSDKVALCAALILGNGQAACKRIEDDGKEVSIPSMTIFRKDAAKEVDEFLGKPFQEFTEDETILDEIADAFSSFAYTKLSDRHKYDESIALLKTEREIESFKKKHEDKKRTSLSKWVSHAWSLGRGIKNQQATKKLQSN